MGKSLNLPPRKSPSLPRVDPITRSKTRPPACRPGKTYDLSIRLLDMSPLIPGGLTRIKRANQLQWCVALDDKNRRWTHTCKLYLCPKCQRRVAVRQKDEIEEIIRGKDPDSLYYGVFSVPGSHVRHSTAILQKSFGDLRRAKMLDPNKGGAIKGGAYRIDPHPTRIESHLPEIQAVLDKTKKPWNVHVDFIMEMDHVNLDLVEFLPSRWKKLTAKYGATGSTYLAPVKHLWNESGFSPMAFYASRRTRGETLLSLDDRRLAHFVSNTGGLRLFNKVGSWRL